MGGYPQHVQQQQMMMMMYQRQQQQMAAYRMRLQQKCMQHMRSDTSLSKVSSGKVQTTSQRKKAHKEAMKKTEMMDDDDFKELAESDVDLDQSLEVTVVGGK